MRGRWSLGVCGLPRVPEEMLDCLKVGLTVEPLKEEAERGGRPS